MLRRLMNLLILWLLVGGIVTSAHASCGPTISQLVDGSEQERLDRITKLHLTGKDAIPKLLAEINNQDIAPRSLTNLFSSKQAIPSRVYCGTVAAYMIELVLGRGHISLAVLGNNEEMLGAGPDNYVYVSGCIVTKNDQKPIDSGVLRDIQRIYISWWKNNSGRSLSELRNEWKGWQRPLTGSDYEWR